MNKLVMVLATMFFALSLSAADTRNVLKKIGEKAAIGNSSYTVTKYDVDDFDVASEVNRLKKDFMDSTGGGCGEPVITVGRRKNIENIETLERDLNSDADTASALKKLWKQDNLKMIVSAMWNGEGDLAESCSLYYFGVFTEDGYELGLDYNITD